MYANLKRSSLVFFYLKTAGFFYQKKKKILKWGMLRRVEKSQVQSLYLSKDVEISF